MFGWSTPKETKKPGNASQAAAPFIEHETRVVTTGLGVRPSLMCWLEKDTRPAPRKMFEQVAEQLRAKAQQYFLWYPVLERSHDRGVPDRDPDAKPLMRIVLLVMQLDPVQIDAKEFVDDLQRQLVPTLVLAAAIAAAPTNVPKAISDAVDGKGLGETILVRPAKLADLLDRVEPAKTFYAELSESFYVFAGTSPSVAATTLSSSSSSSSSSSPSPHARAQQPTGLAQQPAGSSRLDAQAAAAAIQQHVDEQSALVQGRIQMITEGLLPGLQQAIDALEQGLVDAVAQYKTASGVAVD